MRYKIEVFDLELYWPKATTINWNSWAKRLIKTDPTSEVTLDDDGRFGRFTSTRFEGVINLQSLSASIRTDNGLRRASLMKTARDFFMGAVGLVPETAPMMSLEIRLDAKLPRSWDGPAKAALKGAQLYPWVSEDEVVDFVGLKYYIRGEEERALAILEFTPGFVEPTQLAVKLEVFCGGADQTAVRDLELVANRVLDIDLPRLFGRETKE